jgi:ribosome recycling factor
MSVMSEPDLDDLKRRMRGAIDVLHSEFGGLRTGRASTGLLEPLTVEAYGSNMPMNQVGTIGVPDARMLTVQVWDQGLVPAVEKSIMESGLGLNPSRDGNVVRIPIPQLSEERREELVKIAHKYAEQTRVAVRNVRRDGMDKLKRMERDGDLSQDEQRAWGEDLQKLTDESIKEMDEALAAKEKEIMQV